MLCMLQTWDRAKENPRRRSNRDHSLNCVTSVSNMCHSAIELEIDFCGRSTGSRLPQGARHFCKSNLLD